jgi:hypothetical protein
MRVYLCIFNIRVFPSLQQPDFYLLFISEYSFNLSTSPDHSLVVKLGSVLSSLLHGTHSYFLSIQFSKIYLKSKYFPSSFFITSTLIHMPLSPAFHNDHFLCLQPWLLHLKGAWILVWIYIRSYQFLAYMYVPFSLMESHSLYQKPVCLSNLISNMLCFAHFPNL